MDGSECILLEGPTEGEASTDSESLSPAELTALVWPSQVTAALKLIARLWNTPGASCGSTWPNTKVRAGV